MTAVKKPLPSKQWYSVADVARLLDLSDQCVRNWVRLGRIPGVSKFGPRTYRFAKLVVEAWIEARRIANCGPPP